MYLLCSTSIYIMTRRWRCWGREGEVSIATVTRTFRSLLVISHRMYALHFWRPGLLFVLVSMQIQIVSHQSSTPKHPFYRISGKETIQTEPHTVPSPNYIYQTLLSIRDSAQHTMYILHNPPMSPNQTHQDQQARRIFSRLLSTAAAAARRSAQRDRPPQISVPHDHRIDARLHRLVGAVDLLPLPAAYRAQTHACGSLRGVEAKNVGEEAIGE